MILAAIFDMDGVLIDSEPIWRKAIPEVLATVGIKLNAEQAKQTIGLRVNEVVQYWYERYSLTEPSPGVMSQRVTECVIDYVKRDGQLMDGFEHALSVFRDRKMPVALASSSDFILINAVLDTFNIRRHFDVIHSAEHETFGKPHPAVYLATAEKLKVPPYASLAIEDSLVGVIAAKAARMACIAIPEDYPDHEKGFFVADRVVGSLRAVDAEMVRKIEAERSADGRSV